MWTVGGTFQIPAGTFGLLPAMGKGAGKETAAVARAHLQLWCCRDGPGVDGSHAVEWILPGLVLSCCEIFSV